MEIWKDIEGYEGCYQISEYGKVKGLERRIKTPQGTRVLKEKYLKPRMSNHYKKVHLCRDGNCKQYSLHRLVSANFIRPAKNKEVVNHVDGNKSNNHYSNLEFCYQADNNKHAIRNKLWTCYGQNHYLSKLTEQDVINIIAKRNEGKTYLEIANDYDIHETTVGKIIRKETYKNIV